VHVEEFLGVSVVARDLKAARTDPEYSLEAISPAQGPSRRPLQQQQRRPRLIEAVRERVSGHWFPAAAMATVVVLSLGLLLTQKLRPLGPPHAQRDMIKTASQLTSAGGTLLLIRRRPLASTAVAITTALECRRRVFRRANRSIGRWSRTHNSVRWIKRTIVTWSRGVDRQPAESGLDPSAADLD